MDAEKRAQAILADTVQRVQLESEYPVTAREFESNQAKDFQLFTRKQLDYGPGNIMLGGSIDNADDRDLAVKYAVIRMNDKMNRLVNLVVKGGAEAAVDSESVEDTLADLANYSNIARLVINEHWSK